MKKKSAYITSNNYLSSKVTVLNTNLIMPDVHLNSHHIFSVIRNRHESHNNYHNKKKI